VHALTITADSSASKPLPGMSRHCFYGTDPKIKQRYKELAAEL
jgi:hypothetical protein